MKRWKKVLLIVVLVLLVAVVGLLVWQRENVGALYTALTTDQDTILKNMEQSKQKLEDSLTDYDITVFAPTKEQNEALLNGTASADEIKTALGLEDMDDQDAVSSDEASTAEPSQSAVPGESLKPSGQIQTGSTQSQANALVEKCMAELYACQVDLMAQLGSMKQEALSQWNSLDAEQQTSQKLQQIGLDGLMKCYDLEVVTDQEVKAILATYKTKLEAIGADTTVLDSLWKYYSDEKAAQKAYYINKYLN
ncbi:hypothetical protein [uncultured Flavonifractor sp.]|uniref:hypothetical protein n=1 Tax=uncultured Flavonifractor sp. TaxID=1193534 RepID=UPI002622D9D7|nr:hypothetical protein [uncultured Flavonifractor sp.]